MLSKLRDLYPAGIALLDSVKVAVPEPGVVQVVGSSSFQMAGVPESLISMLSALTEGISWRQAEHYSQTRGAEPLLAELARRELLTGLLPVNDNHRLAKQVRWLAHQVDDPSVAQALLSSKRALVLGCGGTGTVVVQHLVAAGVERFVLVDCDVVEPSNFNRQFAFRTEDVGRPKQEALADWVRVRQPAADVRTVSMRVSSAGDLAALSDDVDVIFCCADTPAGHIAAWVAEAAAVHRLVCVFGSVGVGDAAVGPLLRNPSSMARFAEEMRRTAQFADNVIGNMAMAASFGPVNTVTSAWMVSEWVKDTIGVPSLILDRTLVVDLLKGTTEVEATYRGEDSE